MSWLLVPKNMHSLVRGGKVRSNVRVRRFDRRRQSLKGCHMAIVVLGILRSGLSDKIVKGFHLCLNVLHLSVNNANCFIMNRPGCGLKTRIVLICSLARKLKATYHPVYFKLALQCLS